MRVHLSQSVCALSFTQAHRPFGAASPGRMTGRKSFIGVVSQLRAQLVKSRLPSITPDVLVRVAMYGSSTDLEHTLMRYGNETIDARVEPFGWNALHFAVRRGVPRLLEVRTELAARFLPFVLYSASLRLRFFSSTARTPIKPPPTARHRSCSRASSTMPTLRG